jgi:hypothetical protein
VGGHDEARLEHQGPVRQERAVTPQEWQAHLERQADRATARAKWSDGTATITDEDLKHFTGDEVNALINAGRIEGIGPDKRLRR